MFKALLNNNEISIMSRSNPGTCDTSKCRVIAIAQLEAEYLNKTSLNLSFPRDYLETNACARYWKNQYIGYYRFTFGDSIRNRHDDNAISSGAAKRTNPNPKEKKNRGRKIIGNQHQQSKANENFYLFILFLLLLLLYYSCCYYYV